MTLNIRQLRTRCRSPRGFERAGALVEDAARGPLASELDGHLGPSLDRLPAVVRLKHLRVQLRVPSRNLNTMTLAAAWANAFTHAIHRALAHPPGDGAVSSRRYHSEAAYKAAMLHHVATRGIEPGWEFPELKGARSPLPSQAALDILLDDLPLAGDILAELDRQHWLDLLLALWDERLLERIIEAITTGDLARPELSLDQFIELGLSAAQPDMVHSRWPIGTRRQAIRLWVRTHRRRPLRSTWHALRLLERLLEMPALLLLRDTGPLAGAIPFPGWCEAIILGGGGRSDARHRAAGGEAALPGLFAVLEALRPLTPSSASPLSPRGAPATQAWVVSDNAGILLMLPIVSQLDLTRYIHHPQFLRFGGQRAFSFLLAGLGMSLLTRSGPFGAVEPAVALFAGMLGDSDLAGMRHFYSTADAGLVADFVRAETWDEALDRGATEMAAAFAARVRGFRKASRDDVVKQFMRTGGRVLVEDERLLVVLDPTPWSVALHLSGMDDPMGPLEWLGRRRAEFVLEGL